MSFLIALLTLSLAFFFLNLFFQLAKVEKGIQSTVVLLEKFMVVRYNLKRDKGEAEATDAGDKATPAG